MLAVFCNREQQQPVEGIAITSNETGASEQDDSVFSADNEHGNGSSEYVQKQQASFIFDLPEREMTYNGLLSQLTHKTGQAALSNFLEMLPHKTEPIDHSSGNTRFKTAISRNAIYFVHDKEVKQYILLPQQRNFQEMSAEQMNEFSSALALLHKRVINSLLKK